jgi:intergrase/recombinase
VFLRSTKNVFFTFITEDWMDKIATSKLMTYNSIRKRLERRGLNIRFNELRDYFATFMVQNGLITEEVDLLQGRVGKSMFMQHYFSPNVQNLRDRTLKAAHEILAKI